MDLAAVLVGAAVGDVAPLLVALGGAEVVDGDVDGLLSNGRAILVFVYG